MSKLNELSDLLEEQLKDLYSAENQLLKALPKAAKAASTPALAKAFESHLEETHGHVERLEKIGEILEIKLTGKKCKAMEGLVNEASEALEADGNEAVVDAGIIADAQRIEHYEISAYGTARAIAESLGHQDVVKLLQKTIEEEGNADKTLSKISLEKVLPAAGGQPTHTGRAARSSRERQPVGSASHRGR